MTYLDKKYFLLLAAFAGVLLFCGLDTRELFSGDETRVAGITAEMVLDNDPVVPRLNGTPFLEYPPLYYQAGSQRSLRPPSPVRGTPYNHRSR